MDNFQEQIDKLNERLDRQNDSIEKLNERLDRQTDSIEQLLYLMNKLTTNVSNIVNYISSRDTIPKEEYDEIIEDSLMMKSILNYVEKIHFNADYPQNFNVYIADKARFKGQIYESDHWTTRDSRKLSEQIVNDAMIEFKNWADKNPKKRKKLYDEFNEYIINEGRSKFIKDSTNEIAAYLYDRRNMVKPRKS